VINIDAMTSKRKRKPSPAPEQPHVTPVLSKSTVLSVDRPGKKRKLTAVASNFTSPNEGSTKGLEPSNPGKGGHRSDKTTSAVPENPKASSPKPSSALAKRKRPKIIKLSPVAFLGNTLPGSNPTGPWSQRGEGKNKIAVTRRLELGAYLRRCSELINIDGFVTGSF
jgi:hypothetical protein